MPTVILQYDRLDLGHPGEYIDVLMSLMSAADAKRIPPQRSQPCAVAIIRDDAVCHGHGNRRSTRFGEKRHSRPPISVTISPRGQRAMTTGPDAEETNRSKHTLGGTSW